MSKRIGTVHGIAALALLTACGGGGATAKAEAEAFHAQVVVGPGGAMAVEGTALDVRGAHLQLLDDGLRATVTDEADLAGWLRPGMVVTLRGQVRGGTATITSVLHRSAARGTVHANAGPALWVAGVEAVLGPDTPIVDATGAPVDAAALVDGTPVEVNGWGEAAGGWLRASGVRILAAAPPLLVRGWSQGSPVEGVFSLALAPDGARALGVDVRAVTPAPSIPAQALVRCQGADLAGDVLVASSAAIESVIAPVEAGVAVLEGVATRVSEGELQVGPHRVLLPAEVAFDGVPAGGTGRAAVAPGVRLTVRGRSAAAGITAERIRLHGVVRLAGRTLPGSFVVGSAGTGGFTLGGTAVAVGPFTTITDAGGIRRSVVELGDLHGAATGGLPVTVHGYADLDGSLRAYRVEAVDG